VGISETNVATKISRLKSKMKQELGETASAASRSQA
jgi:hypothetical protein